jgi:hypothetical protein
MTPAASHVEHNNTNNTNNNNNNCSIIIMITLKGKYVCYSTMLLNGRMHWNEKLRPTNLGPSHIANLSHNLKLFVSKVP